MTAKIVAHTTNGGVVGRDLSGGVEARSTNGGVNIELASLGADRIVLRTTNGGVVLTVPESAKADVTATCTNGGIQISGAKLEISEQSRRRLPAELSYGVTVLLDEQHPLLLVHGDDPDCTGMDDDVALGGVAGGHSDDVSAHVDDTSAAELHRAVDNGMVQRLVGQRR